MKKANNNKGVIMFAHNNSEIDYFRLAVVNALLVQKNLGIKNITVVTDPHSLSYGEETLGKKLIKKAIKKERYLSKEDAKLINQFIRKIRNELRESSD